MGNAKAADLKIEGEQTAWIKEIKTKDVNCQTEENESTWKNPLEALTKEEWEAEKDVRAARRRKLKTAWGQGEDCGILSVVGSLVARTQMVGKVKQSWEIDGGLMLKLKPKGNKAEIMEARGKLKNSVLWIKENWTENEELVEYWLRRKKERLEYTGVEVRLKYMKTKVGETIWSIW